MAAGRREASATAITAPETEALPHCHGARGEGHEAWTLTFMVKGKRRVERIPRDWVEEVRRRVEAGRAFRDAVGEVLAANAQLLGLARQQRKRKRG